jgi:hypothetical protein
MGLGEERILVQNNIYFYIYNLGDNQHDDRETFCQRQQPSRSPT